MDSKVVLGYWQIRGLAERIRMIMEYAGLPYEEQKYTGETRQKWFNEIKPELQKKNAAITLPYLRDGDEIISESDAVIFHAIHKSGKVQLLGRNCQEQVRIATIYGVMRDLHGQYISLVYGRYNADKSFEEVKPEFLEKFKPYLTKLNSFIGDRQYAAGQITWIDFVLAEFMQCLRLLEPTLISEFSNINNHIDRIWQLPAIKAYHESDRYQQRPCNNPSVAKWH